MYVARLELVNFRCYRQLDVELGPEPLLIVGDNAQGKTSLLEAVFVSATTRSAVGAPDRDLVRWGAGDDDGLAYGQVSAHVRASPPSALAGDSLTHHLIEVVYVVDSGAGAETGSVTKRMRVDGQPRKAIDVVGTLRAVMFAPQDIALVDGPPAVRRRYLDVLLCQIDPAYCRALSRFNKALTQRNHLLRQMKVRGADKEELAFWNDSVVQSGATVLATRRRIVSALDAETKRIHADLAGGGPDVEMSYASTVEPVSSDDGVSIEGEREAFRQALSQSRREESARGQTVVGPHRDDLIFTVGGVDMRPFGSRGQQRTVALALKLAEAKLMESAGGQTPVVLLDDVMSELDPPRRDFLVQRLQSASQVLLTTTDADQVPAEFRQRARVLRVVRGHVETRTGAPATAEPTL